MTNSKIRCCHVAYEYNSITGKCEFIIYSNGSRHDGSHIILREDKTKKYIYIRVRLLHTLYRANWLARPELILTGPIALAGSGLATALTRAETNIRIFRFLL